VQFGVTRALLGAYVRHDEAAQEFGFAPPWYSLEQRFVLERGAAKRPSPPITGKTLATGSAA
jgi:catechol 1,2-dioxygenase